MFKIFIVEDDHQLVRLLEEHMQRFGFETKAVEKFESVLSKFEEFAPHLVLFICKLAKV